MTITLPGKSILYVDGEKLTEHLRAPLEVSYEQIENAVRTVTGTRRVYAVAKKINLSTSWTMVPSDENYTVDGFKSGNYLRDLYANNEEFNVKVWAEDSAAQAQVTPTHDFLGRITQFSYTVQKRNAFGAFVDLWDMSLTIEEM